MNFSRLNFFLISFFYVRLCNCLSVCFAFAQFHFYVSPKNYFLGSSFHCDFYFILFIFLFFQSSTQICPKLYFTIFRISWLLEFSVSPKFCLIKISRKILRPRTFSFSHDFLLNFPIFLQPTKSNFFSVFLVQQLLTNCFENNILR